MFSANLYPARRSTSVVGFDRTLLSSITGNANVAPDPREFLLEIASRIETVRQLHRPIPESGASAVKLGTYSREIRERQGTPARPEGCVSVKWDVQEGMSHLAWEESGGPPVAQPTQKGFGSRLLDELVGRDLGGDVKLNSDPSGVQCGITAKPEKTSA